MSRSLGDMQGHELCGLSAEPEICEHPVGPNDLVLVLGSDGLWDALAPEEAVELAVKMGKHRALEAAKLLADEARSRWVAETGGDFVDDITVLLVHLCPQVPVPPVARDAGAPQEKRV
jgi:serine/threonine protein phosphatase PrpC